MSNQQHHWDTLHKKGNIDHYSDKPTDFAREIIKFIDPNSKILELGCGAGNDSVALANAGHSVIATDFSGVAIAKNTERFRNVPNLIFTVADMNKRIFFSDMFDVVYARLSLHYFTDKVTRRIIDDIHKLLKPNGYLCFICKSTRDPLYGIGTEIEKDMFEHRGHVRHFFSESYAGSLVSNNFRIEKIESGEEVFYGDKSAFVKVIARAKK
ncbi:class I SAM-dependent methyltransferase [Candidatus Woesebacteria bacterium]|nr:MAG: class I SAM-dependent methyltransferase [Candidatus Woesebacteria bacterium]